jgi:hypothetical protein
VDYGSQAGFAGHAAFTRPLQNVQTPAIGQRSPIQRPSPLTALPPPFAGFAQTNGNTLDILPVSSTKGFIMNGSITENQPPIGTIGGVSAKLSVKLVFGIFFTLPGVLLTLDNLDLADANRFLPFWPERIEKIELYAKDSRVAILREGTRLPVSRSGYQRLRELL